MQTQSTFLPLNRPNARFSPFSTQRCVVGARNKRIITWDDIKYNGIPICEAQADRLGLQRAANLVSWCEAHGTPRPARADCCGGYATLCENGYRVMTWNREKTWTNKPSDFGRELWAKWTQNEIVIHSDGSCSQFASQMAKNKIEISRNYRTFRVAECSQIHCNVFHCSQMQILQLYVGPSLLVSIISLLFIVFGNEHTTHHSLAMIDGNRSNWTAQSELLHEHFARCCVCPCASLRLWSCEFSLIFFLHLFCVTHARIRHTGRELCSQKEMSEFEMETHVSCTDLNVWTSISCDWIYL